MSLLNRKVAILEDGVHQATLTAVTEPVKDKKLVFHWNVQGVVIEQQYSNVQILDEHTERFAKQLGLAVEVCILDLVGQQFKVYVSHKVGDNGASFRNVAPATEVEKSSIEIED